MVAESASRRLEGSTASETSEDEFEQFGKVAMDSRRVKRLRVKNEWERWANSAVLKQDKNIKNPIRWW